jgi:hypothetical protein
MVTFKNNKTDDEYLVLGDSINCTNAQFPQNLTMYMKDTFKNKVYVVISSLLRYLLSISSADICSREIEEFKQKFTKVNDRSSKSDS